MSIRPLLVNTSDTGGAGIAAIRLMEALRQNHVAAEMLVYEKHQTHAHTYSARAKMPVPHRWLSRLVMTYNAHYFAQTQSQFQVPFSTNLISHPIDSAFASLNLHILHLHWIGQGLISIPMLARLNYPIVWTMHDMWGFTGGCHTTGDCTRYQQQCGLCPAIQSQREQDISRRVWQQKAKHWTPDLFTIVTPSHWLAAEVRNSPLLCDFTTEVIPNPIDTTMFQPLNRQFARKALHLPEGKKLILFGATDLFDPNKGLNFLLSALQKSSERDTVELVVFGAGKAEHIVSPVPLHSMRAVRDERLLALLYNAVDTVVVPSRQESFGQVAAEALACGTPCITFAATGLIDMIDHQQNGYLAQPFEVDDLAKGIEWVLSEADAAALSHNAREKVLSHYSMDVVAKQYIKVYERVLEESQP